ncbi:MAG: hypothetical protein FJ125_09340 [Deltaproteobacteria bacterium]|nr:hypothetical protein [Deltaproteobacteria bacterium]
MLRPHALTCARSLFTATEYLPPYLSDRASLMGAAGAIALDRKTWTWTWTWTWTCATFVSYRASPGGIRWISETSRSTSSLCNMMKNSADRSGFFDS